jgi:hypothetical protein
MIKLTSHQINEINNLRPLTDSSFLYNTKRWEKLNSEYQPLISDFRNKYISRLDIINAFSDYYQNQGEDVLKPFLLSMIWGFGDTGYGCYRTNLYINSSENRSIIKKSIDVLNSDEPNSIQIAFNGLKSIKGLGVSYLTKVLYFATRALNFNQYTLIFDIRVASSLILLNIPKEIYDIVSIMPSSKYSDFKKFNMIMHDIAHNYNIETENLEMYLFNQEF